MNHDVDIRVRIEDGGDRAIMAIPGDADPTAVNAELLRVKAEEAGIEMTDDVRARLEKIAASFNQSPGPREDIIAEGRAAVHGENGRYEWQPEFDPRNDEGPGSLETCEAGRVNHYKGRTFIRVNVGDHVATIVAPTDGEDGRSVTGEVRRAKPGKAAPIRPDGSFMIDASNRVIVQEEGVLQLSRNVLTVTKYLEVPGCVDFSTGNIDFDGSIEIRDGVRDRFIIKAGGNVEVGGLVEAATILCRGNLHCRRGIAARDRGQVVVGGDAEAGFLNNVRGKVIGNLTIRREILNCQLAVGGEIHCEQGCIIGGRLLVGGAIRVGTLGSDGELPTTIRLGEVPVLAASRRRLTLRREKLASELAAAEERAGTLQRTGSAGGGKPCAQLAELTCELHLVRKKLSNCDDAIAELDARIRQLRTIDVLVTKVVHPNVCLLIGDLEAVIREGIKGPLRIGWDRQRRLIFREGDGAAQPISLIATLRTRAATSPGPEAGEPRRRVA